MKTGVYKLEASYGRMGDLSGVFIATDSDVKKLISSQIKVYFGEVLGKHSEVYGKLESDDISLLTDSAEAVALVGKHGLSNGLNPFEQTSIHFDFDTIKVPDGDCGDDMTIGEIIHLM